MTLLAALDIVIARTGVERYRYLCLEHPRPQVRAEYSSLVLRLALRFDSGQAAEPASSRPTVAESVADVAAIRSCPFRSIGGDGCQCGRCGLKSGAKVSIGECRECVRRYPV